MVFFPLVSNAYLCENAEMARLKKIANNVNFSYVAVEANNKATFTITITNLNPDIVIVDTIRNKTYKYGDNKSNPTEITIGGYQSKQQLKFEMYSNNGKCSDLVVRLAYVPLPGYNPYYKDAICKEISDYKLCQKWYGHNLSYANFKKEVEAYKKNASIVPNETEDENKQIYEQIIRFWSKYYLYILGAIILVSFGGILWLRKKDSFNF